MIGKAAATARKAARLRQPLSARWANSAPTITFAIRKRTPAQASATSKTPAGVSIMMPSWKTGTAARRSSRTANSAVKLCK